MANGAADLAEGGASLAEGGAGLAEGGTGDCTGAVEGLLPAGFIGGTVMVEVNTAGPADDGTVLTMTVPVDFGVAVRKRISL